MLLHDANALRLAVLNSCDTALGGGMDLFASTASILVRQGEIPAVLAMQFAISDPAAIEFSRTFYEAIAEGLPVDAAVAEARKAVRLAIPDTLEWATPVLHQRSPDGVLFDLQRPVEAPGTSSPVSPPLAGAEHATEPGVRSNEVGEVAPQPHSSAGGRPGAGVTGGSGRASLREALGGAVRSGKDPDRGPHSRRRVAGRIGRGRTPPLDREPAPAGTGSGSSSLSAVLSAITIADHALALGDFCERRSLACEGYDDVARRRPGNVVRFTIETEGYKGQKLPISWSMYDATKERVVTEPALRYQDGWPAGFYIPASDEDRNDGELWMPLPPTSGMYFVRVEIQSPDREILNTKDTEPFDVG